MSDRRIPTITTGKVYKIVVGPPVCYRDGNNDEKIGDRAGCSSDKELKISLGSDKHGQDSNRIGQGKWLSDKVREVRLIWLEMC